MNNLTPVPSDPDELRAWLQQLQAAAAGPSVFAGFDANPAIDLPDPPLTVQQLTLKVTLRDAKPPIWRRLVVAGDTTLDDLHDVLQIAMGWTDSHLHRFYPNTDDRGPYFVTEYDEEEGDEGTPEAAARLDQVLREPGDRMLYDYDFGDGWDHDVRLESVSDLSGDPLPRCTGGKQACPPEDVGGIGGYEEVVAWHRAGRTDAAVPPNFDSSANLLEWLPDDFDPDYFDSADADLMLRAAEIANRLVERLRPELVELLAELDPFGSQLAMEWVSRISDTVLGEDDLAAATRHWRVLLDAVGDGVKLSAAGYLPPPVVQHVFDALALDKEWPGTGARENHTPPIAQLRTSAQRLGLLRKAKGELMPTAKARGVHEDAELVAIVIERLPLGREGIEQEAGWFAALGLAAGLSEDSLSLGITALLESRGWQLPDGRLDEWDAHRLARPTVFALTGPVADLSWRRNVPGWVAKVAAQIVVSPRDR